MYSGIAGVEKDRGTAVRGQVIQSPSQSVHGQASPQVLGLVGLGVVARRQKSPI